MGDMHTAVQLGMVGVDEKNRMTGSEARRRLVVPYTAVYCLDRVPFNTSQSNLGPRLAESARK